MSEYLTGSNVEEKVCKNCFYILRPFREDLKDEYFPCQNPNIARMVKLLDTCSDYKHFSGNPADLL